MTTAGQSSAASVLAIIPARYASTRFPGKPLALLAGKPMIQHVVERTRRAPSVTRVVVATDDDRVRWAVEAFGGEVVMTGDHPTGTDRIAAALRADARAHGEPGWVLNVQGDEPLIDPQDLERLIGGMRDVSDAVLGTLVYPLRTEEELHDPHVVKAVLDQRRRALYFSRAPIPYPREPGPAGWRHLGVYLFRTAFLLTFAGLAPTPASQREQLEQLRALEHGYPIHCFEARTLTQGVDVPADLARAARLLHSR
ncbi:MAG: 3-deoxy-manno-octulosonate cytidylyltransferase [Candidatus Lambdaproteobacteria bacterium]|nr:3-deoxy-manno-octulosonate cytidylyltransferase [Candidatus Lambdaproteobacteria bacterium]